MPHAELDATKTVAQQAKFAENGPVCSYFHRAIEFIGRRWMGAILLVLLSGPHRFNEIMAVIPGISDRLLSERLRELEAQGLVLRHVEAGPPVKVAYALTAAGHDLQTIMVEIGEWGHKWLPSTDDSGD